MRASLTRSWERLTTSSSIMPPAKARAGRAGARRTSNPTTPDWDAGSEAADTRAAAAPTTRVVPAGSDAVVIDNSAVGIGGRWDTFQSRLRERRKEVVGTGSA